MNPFGWKDWKELPYRGDGQPRTSKRKRRFVNLKRERREFVTVIIGILAVVSCVIFSAKDTQTPNNNDPGLIPGIIIGAILALTLIAGIASLYKFRKGYDVDVLDEEEKDKDDNKE